MDDLRTRLLRVLGSRCILVAAHDLARWMLARMETNHSDGCSVGPGTRHENVQYDGTSVASDGAAWGPGSSH